MSLSALLISPTDIHTLIRKVENVREGARRVKLGEEVDKSLNVEVDLNKTFIILLNILANLMLSR